MKSNIDGIPLDGIKSVRIHNFTDYLGETKYIRWTEVFLIELNQTESRGEPLDVSKLCEGIARACCIALAPNLDVLVSYGQKQLGLRIHISTEKVIMMTSLINARNSFELLSNSDSCTY